MNKNWKTFWAFWVLIGGLYSSQTVLGNNIQISNVTLAGSMLTFDIGWENSWRVSATPPYNYDAVWIFVKYRDCALMQWTHASIDSASAAGALSADTTADQMGVMVFRTADGVGNVAATSVSLRLTGMPSGNFEFKVFGVEMVHVPQGAFLLGDGISYYTFRRGNITANPFTISSENAITVANSGANLYASGSISTGTIPAAYPKGYDGFYCMKYEISQAQYAEFINTLTSAQAAARLFITTAGRYTLTGAWPVVATTSGNRAMNYMNYDDFFAYLDWSGLRPMSEMEFEKLSRGPATQVPGEYAWGTTLIVDANTLANDGTPSETSTTPIPAGSGIANYNNTTIIGPLRCGFMGSSTTNRLTLGATYFGICETSGNLRERMVHAANNSGRTFVPNHGNGALTPTGLFDVPNWPAVAGTGARGGGYSDAVARLRISDRNQSIFGNNSRYAYMGGRGVRSE
ncbi:MAG TPA: hypothetical protein ENJ82_00990 [Bacteroidetes bacterium]|nr:hypothetical protein [Bacteroidota bacterium]